MAVVSLLFFFVGPFFYGVVGGGVCCLAFFFFIFRKVERMTAEVIRKKALKHAEFESVAQAAAEVPNTKVETLCKIARFDDDIVGEAIQCRATFYGSTIFFYAVDELVTLPDHTQEVRREHLLGKINVSCVDVDAKRISKYHRHINAQQRYAPVKGKCTILTAREGMPLFTVDPTLLLKERLEAAKEERLLLLRQLRKHVRTAARGEAGSAAHGPVNIETMHQLMEADRERRAPSSRRSRSHGRARGTAATASAAEEGESSAARSSSREGTSQELPRSEDAHADAASTDESSAARWLASLMRAVAWAQRFVASLAGRGDASAKKRQRAIAALRSWAMYLTGMDDGGGRRAQRGGRGRSSTKKNRPSGEKKKGDGGTNDSAKLAAMEKTLYGWGVVAIKFPTRRENERWLNLLQSTEQTSQWRDFVAHLPKHDVINLLLARLFFESTRTSGMHDLLVKKIGKNLAHTAKGLPQNVKGQIYLDELVVGGEVPLISNVSDPVHHPSGEVDVDFDLLYRGGLCMSIRFAITYRDIHVPDIIFHIKVLELAGRMRFNVGPPPTEKFWLGGPRPPSLRLEFTQEVASHEGLLNAVVNMLPDMSKVMTNVVKVLLFEDMVLPSLDDFPWPVFDPVDKDVVVMGEEGSEKEEESGSKDGSGAGESDADAADSRAESKPAESETKETAQASQQNRKTRAAQQKADEKQRKKLEKEDKKQSAKGGAAARDEAASSAHTPSPSPKNGAATSLPSPLPPPQPLARAGDTRIFHSATASVCSGHSGDSPEPTAPAASAAKPERITIAAADVARAMGRGEKDGSWDGRAASSAAPVAAEGGRAGIHNGGSGGGTAAFKGVAPAADTVPASLPAAKRFTTTNTGSNRTATGDAATAPARLTAERLRSVRGAADGPSGSLGGGDSAGRRTSGKLDTATVSTTASQRVRRVRKAEKELLQSFPDVGAVEFFSAGAVEVHRGSAGAFVTRGAAAVMASTTSSSRKTSATTTPTPSAPRGSRDEATAADARATGAATRSSTRAEK